MARLSDITLLTHGINHLLPFSLGNHGTVKLWRFPALSFYMNSKKRKHKKAEPMNKLGILAHHGDESSKSIPMVHAESAMVVGDKTRSVDLPACYPDQETTLMKERIAKSYDLIHLACHGQAYTDKTTQARMSALHARAEKLYTQHDILASDIRVDHFYISACLAGLVDNDITGSSAGIVPALFQKRVQSVIGSLVPIPDQGAFLLASLYYFELSHGSDSILALHRALQKLKQAAKNEQSQHPAWDDETKCYLEKLAQQKSILQAIPDVFYENIIGKLDYYRSLLDKSRHQNLQWLEEHLWNTINPKLAARGAITYREELRAKGLTDEILNELEQQLSNITGSHTGNVEERAVNQFARIISKKLPVTFDDLFQIPQQPHLGALLYGMTAFGRLN